MSTGPAALASRYRLRERLGEGGQGEVWLGRDERSGLAVAIKAVPATRGAELRRELALLGGLRHPNLAEPLDLVEAEGACYLVERYAPGDELGRWAARDRAPARIAAAIAAVARGLGYLHRRGVIHRDLKPENVVVEARLLAGLPAARLIDLGLASRVAAPTEGEGAVGTPGYLAPEVMAGERASPASDRYALGVLLFEGLTGRSPRRQLGRLEARELDLLDPRLAALLGALLEVDPAARPSLEAVCEALARIVGRSLAPTLSELGGELRVEPPLLGREPALARIAHAIARAGNGEVSRLALVGPGASRVAREASVLARAAGMRVLAGSHPAQLVPAGAARGDPARERSRLIDELLAAGAPPFLLCLDGVDLDDGETLLLYEELVRALAVAPGAGGIVLHGGALPEQAASGWELLTLPPLDAATTATLVADLLSPLPPPLWLDQVHAATGGDPRLIVELVQAQIAAGLPDRLVEDRSDRAGLIARAVAALGAREREVLAAIAWAIEPVPCALLEEVVTEAALAIEELTRRGLVSLNERGFVPANALARAAARRAGPEGGALAALHARLAAVVRRSAPAARDWLGHHLLLAGELVLGACELARAPGARLEDLRRAAEAIDPGEPVAVELLGALARRQRTRGELEAALASASRLGAFSPEEGALLKAELLLAAGQPARALEALTPARPSRDRARAARARLLEGRACIFLGRHREAAARAEEARGIPELERGLAAQVETLAGLAAVYLGESRDGLAALERAVALADAEGDRETLLRAESARGIALQRLGRRAEAAAALRRCEAAARELGDLRSAASACLNLGTLAHEALELDEALRCYRRAGELAHRSASGTTEVAALANEANLLLLFGELAEVDRQLRRGAAMARSAGALSELGYLELYRAERLLLVDDLEGARQALASGRACLGTDERGRDAADLLEGELLVRGGDAAGAAAVAEALRGRGDRESPERFRVYLLAARAELARATPDLERAGRELALALADRAGVGPLAWSAEAFLATCCSELGRGEEAAWHAGRFEDRIRALASRIPPAHRAQLEERPDLRRARASLQTIRTRPRGSAPSPDDLLGLLALNEELNQSLPLDVLLSRILERALELTGAERGFVLLGEQGDLRLAASRNLDGDSLRRGMEKLSQSIAWLAIEEGRPILVEDAMQDARFVDRLSVSGLRLRAVLCAPFRIRERGRGALYVDNRFRADAFSPRHLALMQAFAGQAGIAITHAQLVDELSRQASALAEAKTKVEAQSRALEAELATQVEALGAATLRLRSHEEALVRKYNDARILGRSKAMRDLFASLDRVAEAEVPVLIWGESGTGKELVARAIHAHGSRHAQPFVSVNCGAIAPTLLESELFGHARGAFTGATRDRPGLFEAAGSGTLLLDEVGDMPADMQVKLLRILQEGSFRRVGEERERRSACRVLSASHKRLDELVAAGVFREDLYYRLQVIQLEVPALRDRREDIPLLCEHILERIRPGLTLAPDAMAALLDHDWPGNVRQLEHELQRAALLCEGSVIEPRQLSIPRRRRPRPVGGLREELRRVEKATIQTALREAGGAVAEAARALGLHRVVLYRRMRELGIAAPGAPRRPRSRKPER